MQSRNPATSPEQLTEDVARLRERLRQAEEELNQFLYSVSHDLRNPLIAIEGLSRLLAEEADTLKPELRDYVQRIVRAAEGLLAKIQGLLDLSRASRGEMALVRFDLGELVDEVSREIKQLFSGRPIEYHFQDSWPSAVGARDRVRRVLALLLDNAVKFVPHERAAVVSVEARRSGEEVIVEVSDNGCGIAAENQRRIFEPFQRLQADQPGLGLGLALARRLVHSWGGRLQVHSLVGQGSRFIFTLPQPPHGWEDQRAHE